MDEKTGQKAEMSAPTSRIAAFGRRDRRPSQERSTVLQKDGRTRGALSIWTLCASLLALLVVLLHFYNIRLYPMLGVDEGIWTIEGKDAALFGDRTMSGFCQVILSPAHFAYLRGIFLFAPATLFSVRLANAWLSLATLVLVFGILKRDMGTRRAFVGTVLLGVSFTFVTISRRAFLESGVILLSVLAVFFSHRRGRWREPAIAVTVALLTLYKSNALYIVPALVVHAWARDGFGAAMRRCLTVAAGLILGVAGFWIVYKAMPAEFLEAYQFEFAKEPPAGSAILRLGRFGIFPAALRESAVGLVTGHTELVVLTVAALAGVVHAGCRRNPTALCLLTWIVLGYGAVLSQSFQHAQYFAPFIVPTAMLCLLCASVCSWPRVLRAGWILMFVAVAGGSLMRECIGWQRARAGTPPMEAVRWVEANVPMDTRILSGPEVAASTERRAYIFHRIFCPLGKQEPPVLADYLRENEIDIIVFDHWETGPMFGYNKRLLRALDGLPEVASGAQWEALSAPDRPDA